MAISNGSGNSNSEKNPSQSGVGSEKFSNINSGPTHPKPAPPPAPPAKKN